MRRCKGMVREGEGRHEVIGRDFVESAARLAEHTKLWDLLCVYILMVVVVVGGRGRKKG